MVSTAKISLNNNERVMINKGHVYQPIADTNCNVRVNCLYSDNTFQGVPTLNTMDVSNQNDMGFDIDVHSNATCCKTPVSPHVYSKTKMRSLLNLKILWIVIQEM